MPAYSGMLPFRPMRRSGREVTDLDDLRGIVSRSQVLRVASSDAEGPFITPLSFGFEVAEHLGGPRWTFWAHCAPEGRKTDAWGAAPEVALELDVAGGLIKGDFACSYSFAYESVMAVARAERVTDPSEKSHGLALVMAHMAPGAPASFSEEALARVDVWRFDVERLTGKRREGEGASVDGKGRAREKKGGRHGKHGKGKGREGGKHREKSGKPLEAGGATPSKKELKRLIESELAGERCPGCGRHCKLLDPHCGKGKKLRERRIEKAGLR